MVLKILILILCLMYTPKTLARCICFVAECCTIGLNANYHVCAFSCVDPC